jgi:glutamate carboxypeptidase
MQEILSYLESRQTEIRSLIRRLVECESPSDDAAAVDRCVDLAASEAAALGRVKVKTFPGGKRARHLRIEFELPGRKKTGQIMALGHLDTVWPVGTLASMPYREDGGRIWGPGVFDMKSGVAFCYWAVRALRDLDLPVNRRLVLVLNSDEEVGSESSRAFIENEARKSAAVLVLEPAAGLDGKLKTGRKGVGDFTVTVTGKPSHAGLDFEAGASAIVELARQIERIASFTDLKRGVTVNPGVISGGTRPNVVAAEAKALCDFRILRLRDAARVEKKFRSLKPFDRRCRIAVEGGLNRPPLERSAAVLSLYRKAKAIAAGMGRPLGECVVGGGSDGNFTAGLGVPTLDGLGPVGEGAHAANEHILADRIPDRIALIAGLIRAV